jgi:hypothetical protein
MIQEMIQMNILFAPRSLGLELPFFSNDCTKEYSHFSATISLGAVLTNDTACDPRSSVSGLQRFFVVTTS